MKVNVKKRILAYIVLVAMGAGALYFLKSSPVEVKLVVDLDEARYLGEQKLVSLKLTVRSDKQWVSSTEYQFADSSYPSGPPAQTRPVTLEIVPGEYEARLDLTYGPGVETHLGPRVQLFQVETADTIHLRGGP